MLKLNTVGLYCENIQAIHSLLIPEKIRKLCANTADDRTFERFRGITVFQ